jgi:hypothetical protein
MGSEELNASGYIQPLDFFGDGVRVPFIVISPFSRGGHVAHTYYDHASILKFIERNAQATDRAQPRQSAESGQRKKMIPMCRSTARPSAISSICLILVATVTTMIAVERADWAYSTTGM